MQGKVESILKSIVALSSPLSHKITRGTRCKARKSLGGFYYDPVTWGATAPRVPTISTGSSPSLEDQEAEEVDEVCVALAFVGL